MEGTMEAAVSDAATAAVTTVAESTGVTISLTAQAKLVFRAVLQVVEAVRLFFIEVLWRVAQWVNLQPLVKYTGITAIVGWVLYLVVRRILNVRWERSMEISRTARLAPKIPRLEAAYEDAPSDAGSEGSGRQSASGEFSASDDSNCGAPTSRRASHARKRCHSCSLMSTTGSGTSDPAALLRQTRVFMDLDEVCLEFLLGHISLKAFAPGAPVFELGKPRDAFLVVKRGQVNIEARPAASDRSHEEYSLGPGETVVGLLFVLASLNADGDSSTSPPESCLLHQSTARAGSQGAEIITLPADAFAEAFDRFPLVMQSMVKSLCTRLSLVVFDTLSTYFGLQQELTVKSSYRISSLTATELSQMEPCEIFMRIIGHEGSEAVDERIAEVLQSATFYECKGGDYPLQPQQRSSHFLVLLEGTIDAQVPGGSEDFSSGLLPPQGTAVARSRSWLRHMRNFALQLEAGDAIGELSILTDQPNKLLYRCTTPCRFAALPREATQRLLELRPRAWTLRLLHLIAARTATWLHRVDAALDWLPVEGRQCLYRKGDTMCGFFVVLSGRLVTLEAHHKKDSGTPTSRSHHQHSSHGVVADILQRGRLCGELDCLRGTPYSQTVLASRDSEVCRIPPTLLHHIAIDFPKAILHFSSLVGPQAAPTLGLSPRSKVTITVVPASDEVNVHEVCDQLYHALVRLGKTQHVTPDSNLLPARSGSGGKAVGRPRTLDTARLARVLADLEERCRWVIYEAEPPVGGEVTDWTQRCVRQADHILVAMNFDGSGRGNVPQSENERYVSESTPVYIGCELLLLHGPVLMERHRRNTDDWFLSTAKAGDLLRPGIANFVAHHAQNLAAGEKAGGALRSTRHYLQPRPWAKRWYHVRVGNVEDWARCARLLAGRGVGICLGGGGARGAVHWGVIRAMQELGIPIDVVSGCSFGALAGAVYAMTAQKPESMMPFIKRLMTKSFSTRKMLLDFNLPRTSYFTGFYLNSVLKDTFARRRCEDLLVPFSCVSTDIQNLEQKLHHEGPLWRIIRGSMSLVGFVPPLPYQERPRDGEEEVRNCLLVDGGYVNTHPIETLRDHGAGTVICVVACPDNQPVCCDYGDCVAGGLVTLRRWFGCSRRATLDPPSQPDIQERLMYLVDTFKEPIGSRADLVIKPDITPFGLLDFSKYKEISQVGYHAAMSSLCKWLVGDSDAARHVHKVIDDTRSDNARKASVEEVEYGTRARSKRRLGFGTHIQRLRALRSSSLFLQGRSTSHDPYCQSD